MWRLDAPEDCVAMVKTMARHQICEPDECWKTTGLSFSEQLQKARKVIL